MSFSSLQTVLSNEFADNWGHAAGLVVNKRGYRPGYFSVPCRFCNRFSGRRRRRVSLVGSRHRSAKGKSWTLLLFATFFLMVVLSEVGGFPYAAGHLWFVLGLSIAAQLVQPGDGCSFFPPLHS
jgi:hypothetical protein